MTTRQLTPFVVGVLTLAACASNANTDTMVDAAGEGPCVTSVTPPPARPVWALTMRRSNRRSCVVTRSPVLLSSNSIVNSKVSGGPTTAESGSVTA